MRVLHLDSGREMRGGQWQVLALMRGLARRNAGQPVEQKLLARNGSPLAHAARQYAIPVESLTPVSLWHHRHWADVVHAHDAASHTLAALAGSRPLVVSRRVAFPVKPGRLSRWKYGRADLFLAVSTHAKQRLLDAGIAEERIRVVYDGVDLLPVAGDRHAVVALESDDPGKCNSLLREAATLGGFPVEFHRDLPAALPGASLFVYLSEEEGLGSAALLAMAAGVAIIASDIPALREVVSDGETGRLVHNEASAVSDAVRELLASPALRTRMGQAGRSRVEAGFLTSYMVENTLAAYRSL